jgi:hypothetical protein
MRKRYRTLESDNLDFELRLKKVYKKRYSDVRDRPDWNFSIISNIIHILKYETEAKPEAKVEAKPEAKAGNEVIIFFDLEKEDISSSNATCNFSLFTTYCKYLKTFNEDKQKEELQTTLNSLLNAFKEKHPLWFTDRRFNKA